MLQQLRANALATSALAVAVAAMSVAIVGLPHNSVGTKQIKKGGVHKTDIHKHAVTTSKLGTGVLSMQGFALAQTNADPSSSPIGSFTQLPFTTKTTGRIFGFGRGSFMVNCTVGNGEVALYLDGTIPFANSRVMLPNSPTVTRVSTFGATATSVPPGVHVISVRGDCESGTPTAGVGGEIVLGGIVIRD